MGTSNARSGRISLAILLVAVLGAAAFLLLRTGGLDPAAPAGRYAVRGLISPEVAAFLDDPEVVAALARRHDLRVEAEVAGSLEMVRGDVEGLDFLWPSDEVAVEVFALTGRSPVRVEAVFRSPLVVYSWDSAVRALEESGAVGRLEDGTYTVNLAAVAARTQAGRTWEDMGLTGVSGAVSVLSGNPTQSAGGLQFAGLLARALAGGAEVAEADLDAVLPALEDYFQGLGYLPATDEALFRRYVQEGVGAYPLAVGYERHILAYAREHPEALPLIEERVRILYPRPTVWAGHPLIALNDEGTRLAEALLDPEIQALAVARHGYRAGVPIPDVEAGALQVPGIPADVEQVVPLPKAAVIDRIIRALEP